MKLKTRDEDRRAMDMLMDRGPASGLTHDVLYASIDSRLRERVARVEKVLSLLDNLPVEEPASDLAARAIRFAERASRQQVGRHTPAAAYGTGPVA